MLNEDIRNRLLSKSAITALVEDRIYPFKVPEKQCFPAVTYQIINQDHDHHLTGASGLVQALVQITCYDFNYSKCTEVREAVRNAMDGFNQTQMGGSFVHNFILQPQESEELIISEDKSQEDIYKIEMEFQVFYQETVPNNLN